MGCKLQRMFLITALPLVSKDKVKYTRDDPKGLILTLLLSPETFFEGHSMHHSNEQALTVIMMLVFSRCTVAFNNYRTLYMVHSIPLACFHVIEL